MLSVAARRLLLIALAGLAACAAPPQPPTTRVAGPTQTLAAVDLPSPTAAPPLADSGWQAAGPGLERRSLDAPLPELNRREQLILFRVDPARSTFRVLYTPGFPAFVSAWDHSARLVFNGSFFDENNAALGLLVADGQRFGQSYVDFGGMFAVDKAGLVAVRSLKAAPYDPSESLSQAVQGFPMLIQPDGSVYTQDDIARARRTAVGQDALGRIVVVIAPDGGLTLAGLAAWLKASDLDLAVALNLDGGGSTGYYAGALDRVDSLTPVPAVIAVFTSPGG